MTDPSDGISLQSVVHPGTCKTMLCRWWSWLRWRIAPPRLNAENLERAMITIRKAQQDMQDKA